MYLFFDTETTGRENSDYPKSDLKHWPRMVQLGWILYDDSGKELERNNHIIKPVGFTIPESVVKIHGITTERALNEGMPVETSLEKFSPVIDKSDVAVGHNIDFDTGVVVAEYLRKELAHSLYETSRFCTMKEPSIINHCKLPHPYYKGQYKWPRLSELHYKLFGEEFEEAHDALIDTEACARCYFELKKLGIL